LAHNGFCTLTRAARGSPFSLSNETDQRERSCNQAVVRFAPPAWNAATRVPRDLSRNKAGEVAE